MSPDDARGPRIVFRIAFAFEDGARFSLFGGFSRAFFWRFFLALFFFCRFLRFPVFRARVRALCSLHRPFVSLFSLSIGFFIGLRFGVTTSLLCVSLFYVFVFAIPA